jgi:transposase
MESSDDDATFALPSDAFGVRFNKHGGQYVKGASYSMLDKLRVGDAISSYKYANGGKVVILQIARQCQVSTTFAIKILNELKVHKRVLSPKDVKCINKQRRDAGYHGAGCRTIDNVVDRHALLCLYTTQPYRTLQSYQDWLTYLTGSRPSRSVISRFFKTQFPHKSGFIKPNQVPYDKFKADNIIRAYEFLEIVLKVDPDKLVFADEKLLKGQELFNRLVRKDPMTGVTPAITVDPDFRNTHAITGFCTTCRDKPAVLFRIHAGNNDSEQFAFDVEVAAQSGYLRRGDYLVIDNAQYHIGRENKAIEDYLWETYGVFVLLLPPRCPEWNPIELVWNILTQRLRSCDIELAKYKYGSNASANMAVDILNGITHEYTEKCFIKCYKFLVDKEYKD